MAFDNLPYNFMKLQEYIQILTTTLLLPITFVVSLTMFNHTMYVVFSIYNLTVYSKGSNIISSILHRESRNDIIILLYILIHREYDFRKVDNTLLFFKFLSSKIIQHIISLIMLQYRKQYRFYFIEIRAFYFTEWNVYNTLLH